MKAAIYTIALVALFQGCGSIPAPEWQERGYAYLNHFIDAYMAGETASADTYFRLLMSNLEKTGDPDIVIRGPLTQCAMDRALLRKNACESAEKYMKVIRDPKNRQYFRFLTEEGTLHRSIPEKYAAIYQSVERCDLGKVEKRLSRYDSPLSHLIAASIAYENRCYNDKIIRDAVDIAASRGWRLAVLVHLTRLQEYYDATDQPENARQIRKRISLIRGAAGSGQK